MDDLQPRTLNAMFQGGLGEKVEMTRRIPGQPILPESPPPETLGVRRDDHESAARFEDSCAFAQGLDRIVQMLDDVIHGNRIKSVRWQICILNRAVETIDVVLLLGRAHRPCIRIDAEDIPPERTHLREELAAAAADIEQAPTGSCAQPHDRSTGYIPERADHRHETPSDPLAARPHHVGITE